LFSSRLDGDIGGCLSRGSGARLYNLPAYRREPIPFMRDWQFFWRSKKWARSCAVEFAALEVNDEHFHSSHQRAWFHSAAQVQNPKANWLALVTDSA